MMMKEINNKTEQILSSLDNIKRTEAPDFFFTRLKARMEREQGFIQKKKWFLRPLYAMVMLLLLLAINVVILFQGHNNDVNTNVANIENDSYQTIASAYNMNDNLLYDINP
jgi:hypothetical protein